MTDSLLQDFQAAIRPTENACPLCELLEEEPVTRADAIRYALSSKLGAEKISRILRKHGYSVTKYAVGKHRNEEHG